jgi:TrmH family RNA methyltransferase
MDTVIRSRTNGLVKEYVRRRDDAASHSTWFVVEGAKLLAEAARSRHAVEQVFVLEGWESKLPEVRGAEVHRVAGPVMEKLSTLASPGWVAALCRRTPGLPPSELLRRTPWLVLDGIQDPGNLGTILRSAEAFGAPPVVLLPPAPSPFQEKVIRASTGSSLRVEYWRPTSHDEFLAALRREGVILCALSPGGDTDLDHAPAGGSRAFIVGNEGHGLSPALAPHVARTVRIPMDPAVESLNAATAASLLLYHLYRSGGRRGKGPHFENRN